MTEKECYVELKTPEVIPRVYGLKDLHTGTIYTFSRYAEGLFLATLPGVKDESMPEFRKYLRGLFEKGEIELSKQRQALLTGDPDLLRYTIREAIKRGTATNKHPGTYKLYDAAFKIKDLTAKIDKIPSRRPAKDKDVISTWYVSFDDRPICNSTGCVFDIVSMVVCPHIAASQYRKASSNPKKKRDLPVEISPMKATEVVFRKYVLGESMKEIDKKELDKEENYNPEYSKRIGKDMALVATFGRKKRIEVPLENKTDIENHLRALDGFMNVYFAPNCRRLGFQNEGYAIEGKGTPRETACESYRRGNIIYRPIIRADMPPVLSRWRLSDKAEISPVRVREDLFADIGNSVIEVDDSTRRWGEHTFIIPNPKMPDGFNPIYVFSGWKADYQRLIAESVENYDEYNRLLRELDLCQ